jgi:hypothetical protein
VQLRAFILAILNAGVLFREGNRFVKASFFYQGNVDNQNSADCRHKDPKSYRVTHTKKGMTLIKTKHIAGD